MRAQRKPAASKTMTLRLDSATLRRLDQLAEVTQRSKAWLAAQAVKDYLELNAWQTRAISAAVKRADARGRQFIDHEKVDEWLVTWGTAQERKPPPAGPAAYPIRGSSWLLAQPTYCPIGFAVEWWKFCGYFTALENGPKYEAIGKSSGTIFKSASESGQAKIQKFTWCRWWWRTR